MRRRHWLDAMDGALFLLGILSFVSLIAFFLAGHDIWHEYASPEVWSRAGQSLPGWYNDGNRCSIEWGVLQTVFVLTLTFHLLLFLRRLLGAGGKPAGYSSGQ